RACPGDLPAISHHVHGGCQTPPAPLVMEVLATRARMTAWGKVMPATDRTPCAPAPTSPPPPPSPVFVIPGLVPGTSRQSATIEVEGAKPLPCPFLRGVLATRARMAEGGTPRHRPDAVVANTCKERPSDSQSQRCFRCFWNNGYYSCSFRLLDCYG